MQHVNVISCQLWPNGVGTWRPRPRRSQQIAWTGLCCVSPGLWMTGSLRGWQVIIHSPGVPHPSLDTTSWGKAGGWRGGTQPWSSHPHSPSLFPPFLHDPLQETGFLLAAQLPRVTSHYQNETWGATDRSLSQVQGQTKSHMSRVRSRD